VSSASGKIFEISHRSNPIPTGPLTYRFRSNKHHPRILFLDQYPETHKMSIHGYINVPRPASLLHHIIHPQLNQAHTQSHSQAHSHHPAYPVEPPAPAAGSVIPLLLKNPVVIKTQAHHPPSPPRRTAPSFSPHHRTSLYLAKHGPKLYKRHPTLLDNTDFMDRKHRRTRREPLAAYHAE